MGEPVAGKFLLEILTKGMYSNPMHVYREYIQNSTDSIDKAVASGVISSSVAAIHIQIDGAKQRIIIHDNGYGIPADKTREILLSIANLIRMAWTREVFEVLDDLQVWLMQKKGVPLDSGLLEENTVWSYLSETAPVDFNSQQFSQAQKIRDYFSEYCCPITCYKILRGSRKLPIYKPYSRTLSTGKQVKTKNTDSVRDVEFVYAEASDGKPLYIGWLALTDFSGIISDEAVQGIRFRKGNILVGNNTTFVK